MTYNVAYASTGLTPAQKNFSADKLECCAAIWGMIYFPYYLLGRKFVLRTDNLILKWLRKKDNVHGAFGRLLIE